MDTSVYARDCFCGEPINSLVLWLRGRARAVLSSEPGCTDVKLTAEESLRASSGITLRRSDSEPHLEASPALSELWFGSCRHRLGWRLHGSDDLSLALVTCQVTRLIIA